MTMTEISILPLEPHAFGVHVVEGDLATDHKVRVPPSLLDDLGPGVDEGALVRASIEFLLERESATSIMSEFSLDDIPRFFPGYLDDVRTRLGRPSG
jgi:hypothetical protein